MRDSFAALRGSTRVLGIDPGTRVLGYGILDVEKGRRPRLVDCGVVRLPPKPLSFRLETIFREIRELIARHEPRVLAIEEVFHGKNFQSVLKVGEARGVVVLAAQMGGLEIREYAPSVIKRAATGNGNADKSQVQKMVARILGLEVLSGPLDLSDALAVAYCHGQRLWREVPGGLAVTRPASPKPASTRKSRPASIPRSASRLPGHARGTGPRSAVAAGSRDGPPARSPAGSAASVALEALLENRGSRVFRGGRFRKGAGSRGSR